jgi:uncharacterized protein with von Willebrand factor type A (vWA) domain
MNANMGGTNINSPLTEAIKKLSVDHPQTRIFLLTDGLVDNRD